MIYIDDMACISAQPTFSNALFEGDIRIQTDLKCYAVEPDFKDLIPSNLLRRMGKAVRMGVGAGFSLIKRNDHLNGIILATANGGLEDCLKFLNQIVDYKEGTLTPTNFVQSTPNAVAGNLALISKNIGYNITHVHQGAAFENAILDVMMLCEAQDGAKYLLGTVDEISDYNFNINKLNKHFKVEPVDSFNLLELKSAGTITGEGAAWFVLSSTPSENSIAAIVDVTSSSYVENTASWIEAFLLRNHVSPKEIDCLIFGNNGDASGDSLYDSVYNSLFSGITQIVYKHLVGEYPTVSSFAVWLGAKILNGAALPEIFIKKQGVQVAPNRILLYNHYSGEQHNLILLNRIN